ncbi:Sortase/acyltransferase [Pseudomonas syringae pv. spinaceae]|uniref:Sortase/acyltransferase n=1 Tax=Pseudomonas syringae pv. spinaceae TaxID=264459 RepID=A0A0Q0A7E8_PSESX|nr:GNAT family N-acetyltransferase [Pseudomonas syringae]KPY59459.1 Sortase/acyltransferase [Pseudomonas syringae pv. spinaceae]RMT28988.1 Sortase/acyltransferase [Pseudomonas syringae pv. spinaceae]
MYDSSSYICRAATLADLPAIVEIYNCAIEAGNSTCDVEPVSVEAWKPWFIKHSGSRRPIWVAEDPRDPKTGVIGYLSLSYFMNERPGYFRTADLGLYIHPLHQSQGVGSFLLRSIMESAALLDIEVIATTVFAHNHKSLRLFENSGFTRWGFMPGVARVRGVDFDLVMVGKKLY